jgi:hypothetical protein
MGRQLKLTHQQMLAYLQGTRDEETQEYIARLREEDPAYQLFFDLVDDLKRQAVFGELPNGSDDLPVTFSAIEDLLMRMLAGNREPADAQRFLQGLRFSPLFYECLIIKLKAATRQMALDDFPEVAQLHVMTDDEIMERIVIKNKGRVEAKTSPVAVFTRRPFEKIWDTLPRLFGSPQRMLRYAIIVAIVAAGAGLSWWRFIVPSGRIQYSVHPDRVPYEYDMSSLRGAALADVEKDSVYFSFVKQFESGIIKYLQRDYVKAIHIWEAQEPAALTLQADSANTSFLPSIRDLYFYFGLSHLTLSANKELTQEIKAQHTNEAIRALSRAQALVLAHHLQRNDNDRETYFLGLAYGLASQPDSAVSRLRKIEPGSRFYTDSQKLIKKWSK